MNTISVDVIRFEAPANYDGEMFRRWSTNCIITGVVIPYPEFKAQVEQRQSQLKRAKRRREPLERGIREWRRKCAREDMRR